MSRTRKHRRPIAEINVVPYIDVMLVLLVIFMITAPLVTEGVRVDIPQGNTTSIFDGAKNPLIITVNGDGELFLNRGENQDSPLLDSVIATVIAEALKADSSTVVMVKGDRRVDYGRVIHAMALAQTAGAPSVGLITESSDTR